MVFLAVMAAGGLLSESLALAVNCDDLATPQDVLECALTQHPEIVRAKAAINQADQLDSFAAQIPNPELNSKDTFGSSLDDSIANLEANLVFNLELGGKRGSRREKAAADKEAAAATLLKAREDVFISVASALNRLRQINAERKIIEEALVTFSRIQKQYRSRQRLGPEQQVSLSVFQLAEGDYRLRRALLETEAASAKRLVSLAVGKPFEAQARLLPKEQTKWPPIEAIDTTEKTPSTAPFNGSAIKLAIAEIKTAEGEYSLAKSVSWPDLKIGPSWQAQSLGPYTSHYFGVNLAFDLPLFQANGGGRAVAYQGVLRAEKSFEQRKRELSAEREVLAEQYDRATQALSEIPSIYEMEKKHRDLEALFARGVIPSSLVIEAHRQIFDFTKSQNEQELAAHEALWKIEAIEGRLLQEKL